MLEHIDDEAMALVHELVSHLNCPEVRQYDGYVHAPVSQFRLYRRTLDRLHELLADRYAESLRRHVAAPGT